MGGFSLNSFLELVVGSMLQVVRGVVGYVGGVLVQQLQAQETVAGVEIPAARTPPSPKPQPPQGFIE